MSMGFIDNINRDISVLTNLRNLTVCGAYWICTFSQNTKTTTDQDSGTTSSYTTNTWTVTPKNNPIYTLLSEKITLLNNLRNNINEFNKDTIQNDLCDIPDTNNLNYQYINAAGKQASVIKYYNKSIDDFEIKPDGYYIRTNLFDMETKTIQGKYISDLNGNISQIENLINQHNQLFQVFSYNASTWTDYTESTSENVKIGQGGNHKTSSYTKSYNGPNKDSDGKSDFHYNTQNKWQRYWEENNKIATVTSTINNLMQPFQIMLNRFIKLQVYIKAYKSLYDSYQDVLMGIGDFINAYSEISSSQDKSLAQTNSELNNVGYYSTYSGNSYLPISYNYVKNAIEVRRNSQYLTKDEDNQYLNDMAISLCLSNRPPTDYHITYYQDETEKTWYWYQDDNTNGPTLNYFDACTFILNFILEVRKAYSI